MKRNLIHVLAIAIAGTTLVATGHAQTSAKRPPPKTATPQSSSVSPRPFDEPSARIHIGERAPDFELEGSNGRHVRLASLRGDWLALVFSDRCTPFANFGGIDRDLRLMGARMVAVCREKAGVVTSTARREQLPFLVLADATGQVSTLYGLRSGIEPRTRPALIVLDRRGVVQTTVIGQEVGPADVVRIVKESMERPATAQRTTR